MSEKRKYGELCDRIGYGFRDESLLVNALTHSSYAHEHGEKYRENNERLEFLGDAFFDAVIAEELYMRLSDNEEGDLSRYRSQIVCERSLLRKAEEISLLQYLRMGHGEARNISNRKSMSIAADAMEAIFGAVYLDGGYDAVRKVIRGLFDDLIAEALQGNLNTDYKSRIHEKLQARDGARLHYNVVRETGPDHDKTFYVELEYQGRVIGRGSGKSKKQAEQEAAGCALKNME